ncbi:hypothetical protein BpHYR1_029530 [Brachionus plicatilis]|uniref:Uncharacterized protein n=1 Tax=Brachionus plicatilis TaxID=10195 RepID=A0A3M7P1V2_BRAPC|nr:hypothetical protein BpHYR1_029530 [Brachionus plicatilis]
MPAGALLFINALNNVFPNLSIFSKSHPFLSISMHIGILPVTSRMSIEAPLSKRSRPTGILRHICKGVSPNLFTIFTSILSYETRHWDQLIIGFIKPKYFIIRRFYSLSSLTISTRLRLHAQCKADILNESKHYLNKYEKNGQSDKSDLIVEKFISI